MTLNELEEKCVFRYRAMSKNTMKEVLNSEIWHSTIDKLNDPFEFPITLDWSELKDCDVGELVKCAKHLSILPKDEIIYYILNHQLDTIRKIVINNLDKLKSSLPEYYSGLYVACFSRTLNSPLMWSHYSDGMRGLCIAYNRDHIEKSDLFNLHSVEYNQSPIKFKYTDLKMIQVMDPVPFYDSENNEDSIGQGYLTRLKSFDYLYQKHDHWAYEGEMRNIIDPNAKKSNPTIGGLIKYPKESVSAIIIGSKMSEIYKKMVVKYCGKNSITVYVASPNLSDYTVQVKAL
jgi:hypothetical protein